MLKFQLKNTRVCLYQQNYSIHSCRFSKQDNSDCNGSTFLESFVPVFERLRRLFRAHIKVLYSTNCTHSFFQLRKLVL